MQALPGREILCNSSIHMWNCCAQLPRLGPVMNCLWTQTTRLTQSFWCHINRNKLKGRYKYEINSKLKWTVKFPASYMCPKTFNGLRKHLWRVLALSKLFQTIPLCREKLSLVTAMAVGETFPARYNPEPRHCKVGLSVTFFATSYPQFMPGTLQCCGQIGASRNLNACQSDPGPLTRQKNALATN